MNTEQIVSLVRSVLKVLGSIAVATGYTDSNTALEIAGGVATLIGLAWSHWYHAGPDAPTAPPRIPMLFAGLAILATLATGCTSVMTSAKAVVVTTKGFGMHVQSSSTAANGAPDVFLGFYSTRVFVMPYSTNGPISVPRYMDTFTDHAGFTLGDDMADNVGWGEVVIGAGTNNTSRATWQPGTALAK